MERMERMDNLNEYLKNTNASEGDIESVGVPSEQIYSDEIIKNYSIELEDILELEDDFPLDYIPSEETLSDIIKIDSLEELSKLVSTISPSNITSDPPLVTPSQTPPNGISTNKNTCDDILLANSGDGSENCGSAASFSWNLESDLELVRLGTNFEQMDSIENIPQSVITGADPLLSSTISNNSTVSSNSTQFHRNVNIRDFDDSNDFDLKLDQMVKTLLKECQQKVNYDIEMSAVDEDPSVASASFELLEIGSEVELSTDETQTTNKGKGKKCEKRDTEEVYLPFGEGTSRGPHYVPQPPQVMTSRRQSKRSISDSNPYGEGPSTRPSRKRFQSESSSPSSYCSAQSSYEDHPYCVSSDEGSLSSNEKRGRGRPSLGRDPEEQKEATKEINRNSAKRYRKKNRQLKEDIFELKPLLESRNTSLRSQVTALELEISRFVALIMRTYGMTIEEIRRKYGKEE